MIREVDQFQGFNVTFHLTEECNLRCDYCYEVNKRPSTLKLEDAKKFIDLILTDDDPIGVRGDPDYEWMIDGALVLDFIGGDPLMMPDLMDEIMEYFVFKTTMLNHRWATNYRMSLSTNGTLFSLNNVRRFMEKWGPVMSIGVSLDGCPEIHNKNRSNSMKAILRDWKWFQSFAGTNAKSTKATLNNESVPYIAESVRYLHEEMGITNINMNFIFEKMEPEVDLVELERQMEKSVAYVMDHHDDLYWSMIKRSIAYPPVAEGDKGWCGSGAMPALSIDGKIYPCFRFVPQNYHDSSVPTFNVGDVENGFDRKDRFGKVRDQTRAKISPAKCGGCWQDGSCAWCIASSYAEKGEFYRQTNICEIQKIQGKWAKIYWDEFDKLYPGNTNGLTPAPGSCRI